jgi:hypothetical protein
VIASKALIRDTCSQCTQAKPAGLKTCAMGNT